MGDVIQHTHGVHGCPCILHCDDVSYLIRLVHHHPEWFLDELLRLLDTNCFISVHYTTIHHELECVGVSLKKLKRIAKERNEEWRMDFLICMSQYSPEQLGFLDETSKDEHTTGHLHGRAARGQHACNHPVFVHGQCVLALGLLTVDGMAASSVVEGSFTTVKYLEFLQSTVVHH
jgi:hypothetical protein